MLSLSLQLCLSPLTHLALCLVWLLSLSVCLSGSLSVLTVWLTRYWVLPVCSHSLLRAVCVHYTSTASLQCWQPATSQLLHVLQLDLPSAVAVTPLSPTHHLAMRRLGPRYRHPQSSCITHYLIRYKAHSLSSRCTVTTTLRTPTGEMTLRTKSTLEIESLVCLPNCVVRNLPFQYT